MSQSTLEEKHLKGIPISRGVAMGPLYLMQKKALSVPKFSISPDEVDGEIQRFRRAIAASRTDLERLQAFLESEGSDEAASIIDTHIQMLEDPFLTTSVEEKIRDHLQNTESIFYRVIADYEEEFLKIKDQFFRQRLCDVKDLSDRVMRNLSRRTQDRIPQAAIEGAIIVGKELAPSDTAEVIEHQIGGLVSQIGGETSHAALIAKGKGIPMVSHIDVAALEGHQGALVIIDAYQGDIYVNPTAERQEFYRNFVLEGDPSPVSESVKVQTKGGADVQVFANIETLSDLDQFEKTVAEGVGLFRTEFLFPKQEIFQISEEMQLGLYLEVIQRMKGRPIVFRLFDVGGDKGRNLLSDEPNPALGCRGIRFLMRHPEIFSRQVRAFLRASVKGRLKILIPMITDIEEVKTTKRFIEKEFESLKEEGVPLMRLPEIGAMIETPSAALTADLIAAQSDFLSIGTNDLVQYTLATDRMNANVSEILRCDHTSIIRLLEFVIKSAGETPVCVCGEMASDTEALKLLLKLGLRQFSCQPRYIYEIVQAIQSF